MLKGADRAKLQNRTQETAIHPDHKKLNLSERESIESRLLPKIIWEREVNSKTNEKKKKNSYKNRSS